MESTCLPDRIQCSEETAELLKKLDKGHWLSKRESCVTAKGKGNLQTFWIGTQSNETPDTSPMHYQSDPSKGFLNPKLQRIVNWNTELLAKMLRQIVAQRSLHGEIDREMSILTDNDGPKEGTVLDEVIEILPLPEYKAASDDEAAEREQVKLDTEVMTQLHDYISQIASLYQDNPL